MVLGSRRGGGASTAWKPPGEMFLPSPAACLVFQEISLPVPWPWSMHSSVPPKQSHHSRGVLHVVPDFGGCFLWSGGIGSGKQLPCAVKPAASCAPHPCARLLSPQLRRLCVLPGAGVQINVSKQDLNQSHYWDQPGFWGCRDVSTSPEVAKTPPTLSPLWLSSDALSSLVQARI